MNIIKAIHDEGLFRNFLAVEKKGLNTWLPWMTALRCLYGLPIAEHRHDFVKQLTGRDADSMPNGGFKTALFLTGRRSGKSRCGAAIPAAYEAVLAGHEKKLAKGEKGIVAVCSPTRSQSRIVKGYLRELFNSSEMLKAQVVEESRYGFELANGVRIEILTGDFRTVRGFTLLAAVIDEIAFFGIDDESKIKSDTELVRAIKPSLATTGGRLIAISSPYARKGWCFKTYQKHWGSPLGKTLVVNAPSRLLNPTLPQEVVDEALAEDLAAAKAEYLGEFRDDVGAYLTREVIERCVIRDRTETLPEPGIRYVAFIDVSGGRKDDAALCIAHRNSRLVCIDLVKRFRPPFNPYDVIGQMAIVLKRWGIRKATADNYAAEFVTQAGRSHGIVIAKAEKPKSQLYLELMPKITSNEIELLDDEASINQLANLERRTRSGGRDVIDHPPGQHDDLANVIAGASSATASHVLRLGALQSHHFSESYRSDD
jgi:hypothetical protein